jgi:hypothetical protein
MDTALMAALGFNAADLDANRAGRLSDGQRERLARSGQRSLRLLIGVAAAIVMGAALLLYLGQRSGSPILGLIGVSMTVINAVVLAFGARSRLRLRDDLQTGRVLAVTGAVHRIVRVQSRIVTYVLAVDDVPGEASGRLSVSRRVFNAFEEGKRYRLYQTAGSRLLVAAEKL